MQTIFSFQWAYAAVSKQMKTAKIVFGFEYSTYQSVIPIIFEPARYNLGFKYKKSDKFQQLEIGCKTQQMCPETALILPPEYVSRFNSRITDYSRTRWIIKEWHEVNGIKVSSSSTVTLDALLQLNLDLITIQVIVRILTGGFLFIWLINVVNNNLNFCLRNSRMAGDPIAEKAAASILIRAVELDTSKRFTEALICYQEGLQFLMEALKAKGILVSNIN